MNKQKPEKPKIRYIAHFKGGPVGGTTQNFDQLHPTWRVPVAPRPSSGFISGSTQMNHPWEKMYEIATYVLDRYSKFYSKGQCHAGFDADEIVFEVDYYWEDPSEYLQAENARLKKQVTELELKFEEEGKLHEALKILKDALS